MSWEHLHVWIGMSGDVFTFLGGAILSLDAVNQYKEAQKKARVIRTLSQPGFDKLKIEIAGEPIETELDITLAFIRRSARVARYGFGILSLGCLLLIASRIVELSN